MGWKGILDRALLGGLMGDLDGCPLVKLMGVLDGVLISFFLPPLSLSHWHWHWFSFHVYDVSHFLFFFWDSLLLIHVIGRFLLCVFSFLVQVRRGEWGGGGGVDNTVGEISFFHFIAV